MNGFGTILILKFGMLLVKKTEVPLRNQRNFEDTADESLQKDKIFLKTGEKETPVTIEAEIILLAKVV